MSIQGVINTASRLEVIRNEVVAQTVTRSGRIYTAVRDTVKPWQFKVTPADVYPWELVRPAVESVSSTDRYNEVTISFNISGQAWMFQYQGELDNTQLANDIVITGFNQRTITVSIGGSISSMTSDAILFKPGDVIQPIEGNHRYPYVVTSWITRGSVSTLSIPVHRNIIGTVTGRGLRVGPDCQFQVIVTKSPSYQLIPGKLVQFTGDFELLENVI
jgi:hypothetical protein